MPERWRYRSRRWPSFLRFAVVLSVTARSAAAQGVNVQFTELDCDSDPEVIVVSNQGTQPVEMSGWNLQSDPTVAGIAPTRVFGVPIAWGVHTG